MDIHLLKRYTIHIIQYVIKGKALAPLNPNNEYEKHMKVTFSNKLIYIVCSGVWWKCCTGTDHAESQQKCLFIQTQ